MTKLATQVGLSKTPVTLRVQQLEKAGIIRGYRADISHEKLGFEYVAFLEVKLVDTHETSLQKFNEAVKQISAIESCLMIAGGFDYLLKVRTRSMQDYRRVLGEEISNLPKISSSSTFVSMETVKD